MDMTTILTSPWPKSLSDFVVACLSWDPKRRPTSVQCMNHEYFRDVERYLPIRDPLPSMFSYDVAEIAPPASMHVSSQIVGKVESPKPPRVRQQSYFTIP